MIRILLDPGHGGNSDTGAVANGFIEKDLNLKLCPLVRTELERSGIEVEVTRTDDVAVSLYDRGLMAKTKSCNAIISLHFNSDDGQASGPEVWYSFLPQVASSSKWIAECIYNEAVKLGKSRRGVFTKESDTYPERNYYGVLRNAEPVPGVICEGLFLDNIGDIAILKQPDYLKNLAIAYAKGICIAYGITYISEKDVQEVSIYKPVYPFKDWDSISDDAKESTRKLKELDIFVGDTEGNFNPKSPVTREQLAIVLGKLISAGR